MLSLEFIRSRLQATGHTQLEIAAAGNSSGTGWVWSGKAANQWGLDAEALQELILSENAKRTQWRNAAELWDGDLSKIQNITRSVTSEGKYHFRKDPTKLALFEGLQTDGRSRPDIFDQGVQARDVWTEADPNWSYLKDFTVGDFSSLITSAMTREATHGSKWTAWRRAASTLMNTARGFHDDCVAWYGAATRKFGPGTAEGVLIRSAVPTTSQPEQPVGTAIISNLMAMGGTIHFDCTAPNARRYTYLHQAPGSSVFTVIETETPETSVTLHNQPPGLHRFKAFGGNAEGEGPESAVVEITVAQANAA